MVSEKLKAKTVCVVGLGYVGFPLAEAFSKHLKTIGFDIGRSKVKRLNEKKGDHPLYSSDPSLIRQADFVIIAVPTPVTKSKEPDLSYLPKLRILTHNPLFLQETFPHIHTDFTDFKHPLSFFHNYANNP